MRRGLFLLVSFLAMIALFVLSACSSGEASLNPGSMGVSQDDSQKIARRYVIDGPTFQFDGMMETLALSNTTTLKCPYCWEFLYQFDCRQAGYGDRTGLMVAQVITPHTARIVVQEGKVASAVMDGRWDMVGQRMIGNNTT